VKPVSSVVHWEPLLTHIFSMEERNLVRSRTSTRYRYITVTEETTSTSEEGFSTQNIFGTTAMRLLDKFKILPY